MGIGNLGSPVPDSEARNVRLLKAAGYNDATIQHCIPSYQGDPRTPVDSGYPKMSDMVARPGNKGDTQYLTIEGAISPLGKLPNEESNQPRTSGKDTGGAEY